MFKKILTGLLVITLTTVVTLPACDCYENHVESEECPCECHGVAPATTDRHWIEG
ncbi:MAG: hypothetical protein IJ356_01330 [Erysipelotrichaceae bacterium]|nr:hypothetical protein [Erysipelotrichaceae bacterium]